MTVSGYGFVMADEWHPHAERERECGDCEHFEHNYCEGYSSDHFAHMLLPIHPACEEFRQWY